MRKTAAIIGGTGLIGQELLLHLLNSDKYEKVYLLHYKRPTINHSKLEFVEVDFDDFALLSIDSKIDEAFCTIGTTLKKAGSVAKFRKIDIEYPLSFASWFKRQGGNSFSVVSAITANSEASSYYNKAKGEMENGLRELNFVKLFIYQPSILIGHRDESRLFESVGIKLMSFLNPLMRGKLKDYRGIEACQVALAIYQENQNSDDGEHVFKWEEMSKWSL
jgi:uncharacterized protein YbjT (DUF2867 family)